MAVSVAARAGMAVDVACGAAVGGADVAGAVAGAEAGAQAVRRRMVIKVKREIFLVIVANLLASL